MTTIHSR